MDAWGLVPVISYADGDLGLRKGVLLGHLRILMCAGGPAWTWLLGRRHAAGEDTGLVDGLYSLKP